MKTATKALLIAAVLSLTGCSKPVAVAPRPEPVNPVAKRARPHLDHSPYYTQPIRTPQELTRSCLRCHPDAAGEIMKTAHWTWLSGDAQRNGQTLRIGKRNLMNNFCISVTGNWASCTACHAGYGWTDSNYDFSRAENVDCLVCHDGSGTYSKGKGGLPKPGVDLAAAAQSVRAPYRENCGTCHFNGGGGMGVKHGDLDDSLLNASDELDVHLGKLDFQCIDCHQAKAHFIPGKINATYGEATQVERLDCASCHTEKPHADRRLNFHVERIACQTCHIPAYARKFPTKMEWDWSAAGDGRRKESPHEYLKIKGTFRYGTNVVPEYAWFNGKMDRYLTGDRLSSERDQPINRPLGSRKDPSARIWPFKIHRGRQIYDPVNKLLLPPVTSGEGGYWSRFDWTAAVKKGAALAGIPFSGKTAFVTTHMYWPITHMIAPAKQALACVACHSENGRLDWKSLGYAADPAGG
ncbi:MAG: tetrathionate reductase family octaheme c-type cytochrome [Oligoflexia bacterium]|nr:tetrathionate reductase family octaheme c-type cytochrome [Oligoflexia bacterium]